MARKPAKSENGTIGGAGEPVGLVDGGAVEIGDATSGNQSGVDGSENGTSELAPNAADPNVTAAKSKRGRPALTDEEKARRLALKSAQAEKPLDPKEAGKALAGYHALAALATGVPELAIGEEKAIALAKAYGEICDHYGITKLPKEVKLWLALVTATGVAYGPVITAVYKRKTGVSMLDALNGAPKRATAPPPLAGGIELDIVKPNGSHRPPVEMAPPGIVVIPTGPKPNTPDGRYKI